MTRFSRACLVVWAVASTLGFVVQVAKGNAAAAVWALDTLLAVVVVALSWRSLARSQERAYSLAARLRAAQQRGGA